MKFEYLPGFRKDVKRLLKKYRTLGDDIEVKKLVLEVVPGERPPFSYRIDNLGIETCVIKIRKMACKSLRGRGVNSGLRMVYAHFPEELRIVLTELYHKSEKQSEDRDRILKNFK